MNYVKDMEASTFSEICLYIFSITFFYRKAIRTRGLNALQHIWLTLANLREYIQMVSKFFFFIMWPNFFLERSVLPSFLSF